MKKSIVFLFLAVLAGLAIQGCIYSVVPANRTVAYSYVDNYEPGYITLKVYDSRWVFCRGVNEIAVWDYYANGSCVRRGEVINGSVKMFYDPDHVASEMMFNNNMRDGYYRPYWANGKLRESGTYARDKKDGDWKAYYSNGNMYTEYPYRSGVQGKAAYKGSEKLKADKKEWDWKFVGNMDKTKKISTEPFDKNNIYPKTTAKTRIYGSNAPVMKNGPGTGSNMNNNNGQYNNGNNRQDNNSGNINDNNTVKLKNFDKNGQYDNGNNGQDNRNTNYNNGNNNGNQGDFKNNGQYNNGNKGQDNNGGNNNGGNNNGENNNGENNNGKQGDYKNNNQYNGGKWQDNGGANSKDLNNGVQPNNLKNNGQYDNGNKGQDDKGKNYNYNQQQKQQPQAAVSPADAGTGESAGVQHSGRHKHNDMASGQEKQSAATSPASVEKAGNAADSSGKHIADDNSGRSANKDNQQQNDAAQGNSSKEGPNDSTDQAGSQSSGDIKSPRGQDRSSHTANDNVNSGTAAGGDNGNNGNGYGKKAGSDAVNNGTGSDNTPTDTKDDSQGHNRNSRQKDDGQGKDEGESKN